MGEEKQSDTDLYLDSDASDEQNPLGENNTSVTQVRCSVVPSSSPGLETKETEKHFQNGQRRHSFLETENNTRKTGEMRTDEPGVGRGAPGVSRNDQPTQDKSVDLKRASSIPVTKSLTGLRSSVVDIPFSCSGQEHPDTSKGNVNKGSQGPNGLLNRRCVQNPRDQGILPRNADGNADRNVAVTLPNPNLVVTDCPCYDNIVNEYLANQVSEEAVESEAIAAQNVDARDQIYVLVPQQRTPVAYGNNGEDFQYKAEERKRKARLMLTYLSRDINGLFSETHIEKIIDLFVEFEGRRQRVRLPITYLSFEMIGTISETLIARILDIFDCIYERGELRYENA